MTVRVVLSTGVSGDYAGGEKEFDIDARNLRGVVKELESRFPGLGEFLEDETTVAIDGEIHDPSSAFFTPLRDGCEVFFLPKIEAG